MPFLPFLCLVFFSYSLIHLIGHHPVPDVDDVFISLFNHHVYCHSSLMFQEHDQKRVYFYVWSRMGTTEGVGDPDVFHPQRYPRHMMGNFWYNVGYPQSPEQEHMFTMYLSHNERFLALG